MYVRVSKKHRETPLLGASVIDTEAKSDVSRIDAFVCCISIWTRACLTEPHI